MRKLILILSSCVLIGGCYYDVADELYPGNGGTANCDTTVTGYAAKISPVMSANCAIPGCHVAGGNPPDLTNYTNVSANSALIMTRAVVQKDMPPAGPMSACDILAVQRWIENGSLNN
ncbi:MAG: hypothetical protein ABI772_00335 [Bacteroidota bacterium]